MKVFVAHFAGDRLVAAELADLIFELDHEVFLENYKKGFHSFQLGNETWKKSVERAIREWADRVVVVWSKAASESESGLHFEIKTALAAMENLPPGFPFLSVVRAGPDAEPHPDLSEHYHLSYPLSDSQMATLVEFLARKGPSTVRQVEPTVAKEARLQSDPKKFLLDTVLGEYWGPQYPLTIFGDFGHYQRIAGAVAAFGEHLIAWTMHGSPLEVDDSALQNHLSKEDRMFAAVKTPPKGKYRLVIFEDKSDVESYIAHRPGGSITRFQQEEVEPKKTARVMAFEKCMEGSTLLFSSVPWLQACLKEGKNGGVEGTVRDFDMGIALRSERKGLLFESGFRTDPYNRGRDWHITFSVIGGDMGGSRVPYDSEEYYSLFGDIKAKRDFVEDYFISDRKSLDRAFFSADNLHKLLDVT